MPPKHLYKSTTENVLFFNREQTFVFKKVVKLPKIIIFIGFRKKADDKVIDKRFLRQELFVLNDQFV